MVAAAWWRVHAAGGAMVTDGPYATVRHPQYSGLIVTIWDADPVATIVTLAMAPVLVATYYRLARREESAMGAALRARYERCMAEVPMLVPRLGQRSDADVEALREERTGLR